MNDYTMVTRCVRIRYSSSLMSIFIFCNMATKRTQSQRPPGLQSTSQIFDPIYTSELDSDESGVSTEEEQDPTYDYSSEEMDYLEVQDDDGENVDAATEDLD